MIVGVPTEIKTDEYRVALTPAGVRELAEHDHDVVVEAGAGEGSAISDDDYRKSMTGAGVPGPYVDQMLELFRYIRAGKFPKSGTAIKNVTGREPIAFDQFARDYAKAWAA